MVNDSPPVGGDKQIFQINRTQRIMNYEIRNNRLNAIHYRLSTLKMALIMQNKPNLMNGKTAVTSVLAKDYENKPLSTKIETQIMQNKPNLPTARMNITTATKKTYRNFTLSGSRQNKPNQTQFQTCVQKTRKKRFIYFLILLLFFYFQYVLK
ncbi:MAG: hypothetical protein ACYTBP_05225 [Planctomycetota bacterium]